MYKNEALYNIATDMNNVYPDINKLTLEIADRNFSQTFQGIQTDGVDIQIGFTTDLLAGEITILNQIVANHNPAFVYPYNVVSTNISTNLTDTYQTANTVKLYIYNSGYYRIDTNLRISSTLTGLDFRITIDGNPVLTVTQPLSSSLLGIVQNLSFFTSEYLLNGIYDIEIQFRRASTLSSSTILEFFVTEFSINCKNSLQKMKIFLLIIRKIFTI